MAVQDSLQSANDNRGKSLGVFLSLQSSKALHKRFIFAEQNAIMHLQ